MNINKIGGIKYKNPNPFEFYGITHLSAASLNLYSHFPALWVTEKLLKEKCLPNPVLARKNAVELALDHALHTPSLTLEETLGIATKEYNKLLDGFESDKVASERDTLLGYLKNALPFLKAYGEPVSYQEKFSLDLPGVPVPLIGYTDWKFFYEECVIIDLKTTGSLPYDFSDSHAREAALYATANPTYQVKVLYVKPTGVMRGAKPYVTFDLTEEQRVEHMTQLAGIALRLGRFLSLSKDAYELAGLVCPEFDSFYLTRGETAALTRLVYGYACI